ncbi:hypothetical protein FACS189487_08620 [Campylobacterota bacterium]|nr:hypothetical protein FACS189487_08620 [Campylobacterota bacterium]
MKVKQISLRCFEIEHSGADELKKYLEANAEILKQYLILMVGEYDAECERVLEKEFVFAWARRDRALVSKVPKAAQHGEQMPQMQMPPQPQPIAQAPQTQMPQSIAQIGGKREQRAPADTLIMRKTVRSGESIPARGDALFFAQINNGAEVFVNGNCFLFAPLYGVCYARGDSAIVMSVGANGLFLFHDKPFESSFFNAPKRFFWNNGEIIIENHIIGESHK